MRSAADWIQQLQLEPHREGGYFRRIYQAEHRAPVVTPDGPRFSMTAIYYMLTADKPVGCMHKNKSDIMHVYCGGEALTYYLLSESGEFETRVLGPNPWLGHQLQFVVPGGVWKATELSLDDNSRSDFGLLCEVVVPGFDYADMETADRERMVKEFPQHKKLMSKFCF